MTIQTLFGPEEISQKRSYRFKVIRPVYETLIIKESLPEYIDTKAKLTDPGHIWEMFRFLGRETKEYVYTLHLDGKNRMICIDMISVGSLNQSIVHPREVFKSTLLSSAAAIVMIHNHPTGDTTPSREDLELTRRLKEGGELLGVRILDHIIVSDSEYTSLANLGLI